MFIPGVYHIAHLLSNVNSYLTKGGTKCNMISPEYIAEVNHIACFVMQIALNSYLSTVDNMQLMGDNFK